MPRSVAVITGASSGIGAATARLLHARQPHTDILLVARRGERLEALAEELNGADPHGHRHLHHLALDLTQADAGERVAAEVTDRFGRLDLLVNNAGARWSATFVDGGADNVVQTMSINFDAQVRLTQALLPLLMGAARAAGPPGPAIVNVASTAARIARPGTGAYSASKFALAGWSDALALELAPQGIHVGVIFPGFIATEGFPATELVSHPVKRHLVAQPEQAAAAILTAGLHGRHEVYVPRFYRAFAILRTLAPGLVRRAVAGGGLSTASALDRD